MEQNFQEQAAGPDSYRVRRGSGTADKTACVAVFAEEHSHQPLELAAVLHCAQSNNAFIHAHLVKSVDLTHYGHMDHLATAGDKEIFANYTAAQDREEAQRVFAPLLAAEGVHCLIHLMYEPKLICARIEALRAENNELYLFWQRKKQCPSSPSTNDHAIVITNWNKK